MPQRPYSAVPVVGPRHYFTIPGIRPLGSAGNVPAARFLGMASPFDKIELEMSALKGLERARHSDHLPAVRSRRAIHALLDKVEPPFGLLGKILYGSGLRLLEYLAVPVNDVDLERRQIMVRRGKGSHDRGALLPARAARP